MGDDEKNAIIEHINAFWSLPRPKNEDEGAKKQLIPIHDFDKLDFSDPEHIAAVREKYDPEDKR